MLLIWCEVQLSSHFDRTSLVKKGFIIMATERTFYCRTNAGNSKWVIWAHLTPLW